jgi:hypothetical protein
MELRKANHGLRTNGAEEGELFMTNGFYSAI